MLIRLIIYYKCKWKSLLAFIVFGFRNHQDTGWKTANQFLFSHLFSTATNSSSDLRWHPNLCGQKCFPVTRSFPDQDTSFLIFMLLIFLVAGYCCSVLCWVSSSPPEELCGLLSIPVLNLLFFFCLISLHTLIHEWNFTSSLCPGDSCTSPSLLDRVLV